jgi:hypothetical protein
MPKLFVARHHPAELTLLSFHGPGRSSTVALRAGRPGRA